MPRRLMSAVSRQFQDRAIQWAFNDSFSFNGGSIVVEFTNDPLKDVNGLFAVVVSKLDRNPDTVNIASNYLARSHFAKTHDLIGMQRINNPFDDQRRNFLGQDRVFHQ